MTGPHPRHVERIRKMKQRQAVRSWEFRQRRGSKGVWDRLRGLLARSERAYALDAATLAALREIGLEPHRVGGELEPTRTYLVLAAGQASLVAHLPEIEVGLGAAFLDVPHVALVYFDGLAAPRTAGGADSAPRS